MVIGTFPALPHDEREAKPLYADLSIPVGGRYKLVVSTRPLHPVFNTPASTCPKVSVTEVADHRIGDRG